MLFYLWKRNSTYYYRIKIPSDLSDLFPVHHIRIFLKTKNLEAAKVSAASINQRVQNCFALLRSGAVDADVSYSLIEAILPKRNRFKVVEVEESKDHSPTLSELVQAYISDRSPHWTEKTKLEFSCQLVMLLEIMGDRTVDSFSRVDCLRCRDPLIKLPTN